MVIVPVVFMMSFLLGFRSFQMPSFLIVELRENVGVNGESQHPEARRKIRRARVNLWLKRKVKHRPAALKALVVTFGFSGSPDGRAAIEVAV